MDSAYHIRIFFRKEGEKIIEMRFRYVVGRSPHAAIAKALCKSRGPKGFRGCHENYGCEEIDIKVKCLGPVDK